MEQCEDTAALELLAQRLGEKILAGLGPRSQWALRTALDAMDTDGVAGVLVVTVPAKCKERLDVSFTVGTVDVISRWGAA